MHSIRQVDSSLLTFSIGGFDGRRILASCLFLGRFGLTRITVVIFDDGFRTDANTSTVEPFYQSKGRKNQPSVSLPKSKTYHDKCHKQS